MWEFVCPKCKHRVEGHPSMVGKLLQCYNCGTIMTVSDGDSTAADPAPKPAAPDPAPSPNPAKPRLSSIVVLCIVGALVVTGLGLFVLSIGGLRNSAALAMTKNRMMQIGLALHAFHDTNRSIPAPNLKSSGARGPGEKPIEADLSWRLAVLPYLDEFSFWQSIPFDASWEDPRNIGLQERMPAILAHGDPVKAS